MSTYTDEQIDRILEDVLPCDAKNIYERTIARLSLELGTHVTDARGRVDGDPVNRILWGISVGARQYNGPVIDRVTRTGPFTWAERKILRWAFPVDGKLPKESKFTPTLVSVAWILHRPVSVVEAFVSQRNSGIVGFGLSFCEGP